jgi:hypothetical protein
MAKKTTKKTNKTEEVINDSLLQQEEIKKSESVKKEIIQEMDSKTDNVQNIVENEHLFTVDVSNYGIKKDEAEKLVNTALKFYFENKDKTFVVESEVEITETKEESNILNLISEYEKTLKLFNYVPKNKVLSFLKILKENL